MLNRRGQDEAETLGEDEGEMTYTGAAPQAADQRSISFLGWGAAIAIGLLLWAAILVALGVLRF